MRRPTDDIAPPRISIRHEQDTMTKTRQDRKDETARRYDEKPTTRRENEKHGRDAINEKPPQDANTRRKSEMLDETRDEKARYILKADHWPRKRLSTFSTMREYNTDTGRRMMPSDEIHNMNTMGI